MPYTPPPDYGHHRQADAEAAKRVQRQQKEFADKQKREEAERKRRRQEELAAESRRRAGETRQGR